MYEFGVDFIARCLAGEALAKAGEAALNLVAGDNIDITYNSSTGETVISNTMEVDDELSLSSENPVQNKVITDALRYKPDTYTGETKVANQKIVQLTRAQYDAIQNKDPNTYYMITDDVEPCVRTAYKDMTYDYMSRTEDGDLFVTFAVPEDFTMLEARICYDVTWSCGSWDHATNSLTSVLSVTPRIQDPPRDGRKTYMGVLTDQYIGTAPNQTHVVVDTARLGGANYITYDNDSHTVTIRITKPNYAYNYLTGDEVDNTNLTVHGYAVTEVGYVAFGADNITITESDYTAGEGININPDGVISIDADYGASLEMTIDPDTYVITTVLKDQNGNTLGQAQSIDLPLESVVVSGRYDTATKTIILTLEGGSTISIPVGDLVSGLESESNKVTSIGAGSTNVEYPSAKAVYDAIQNINEVPDATPVVDTGKVLTVDGTGNAVWSTPSTGVTDYTLLNNKPSINNVELNGNKTAADLGLVESSELNNYLTISSAANTYQTKSGMANYLTTADAATLYQPKGIGVGKNVDDTSFTLDGTTYTADTGCEVFNHSPYDMTTSNKASGFYSHVEGDNNTIATGSGKSNHAEGTGNTIIGDNANHIEGQGNRINNSMASCNHVEGGVNTLTSNGAWNHIEGTGNTISGSTLGAHAEGAGNTATGDYCHVEGGDNTASGSYSHAQGNHTVASGAYGTAAGEGTIAAGIAQVAIGKFNVATANDDTYPLVVGNGTVNNRSDCFKIDKTGKIYVGNNPNGVDVTAIKEVPDATAADAGKVLTATGADTYAWSTTSTPANVEVITNKVTSLSASSTDTQYPSAKCVYDLIGDVETILATLTTP